MKQRVVEAKVIDGEIHKKCRKCEEFKPLDDFHKSSEAPGGLQYQCKDCISTYNRQRNAENPDYVREHNLRNKFKLSLEDYNELYKTQEGKCFICKEFHNTLCVDHDHKTEKIRALLCSSCNKGLGNFRDNIMIMRYAIEYLESFSHDR